MTQRSLAAYFGGVKAKPPAPKKKLEPFPEELLPEASPESIFDSSLALAANMEPSWRAVLKDEFQKPYMGELLAKLRAETRTMYPPKADILNAFTFCPFENVKVVIIGQDPYPNVGQAHGLSFSVRPGVAVPRSLSNIYKELAATMGSSFQRPNHGNLESWARQGVLLLNAVLTVGAQSSDSHASYGWNHLTSAAISAINKHLDNVVFLAWGNKAKAVCKGVDKKKHCLLTSGHPSPLSVKYFLGCDHFRKANEYLKAHDRDPIDWCSVCREQP